MALEGIAGKEPYRDFPKPEPPAPRKVQPEVPRVTGIAAQQSEGKPLDYAEFLQQMLSMVPPYDTELKYIVNRDLNEVVVKVIDSRTDKVIREIPPEEIQRLQARIRDAVGLLIDEKA